MKTPDFRKLPYYLSLISGNAGRRKLFEGGNRKAEGGSGSCFRLPPSAFRLRTGCLVLIALLTLAACTEPPPVALNSEERALIDTLYGEKAGVLRVELDSLCEVITEREMPRLVDSIVRERKAEEVRLKARIQEELENR